MTLIWHYTISDYLEAILRDGVIRSYSHLDARRAPERIEDVWRHGADTRDVAIWFSRNQWWEPTSAKGLPPELGEDGRRGRTATFDEMVDIYGICRIGVEPGFAPVSFRQYADAVGMEQGFRASMERYGRARGANPRDWHCTFEPVTREAWRAVERWDGNRWVPVPIGAWGQAA